MGYTAWSAGAFSPVDYNLTMTPMGSPGNFTDQKTLSQCVVGTRNGNSNATATGSTVAVAASTQLSVGGAAQAALVGVVALMSWLI